MLPLVGGKIKTSLLTKTTTRSCRTRKRVVHVYSPRVAATPAAATTAAAAAVI